MARIGEYMHTEPLRRPPRRVVAQWLRDTRVMFVLLFGSYEPSLGEPERGFPPTRDMSDSDRAQLLGWATKFYDQSWTSMGAAQDKAQKLLGTIGVTVPLLIALGVFARQSIAGGVGTLALTALVLALVSVALLLLSLFACLRCLAVTEFWAPYLEMVLDPQTERFRTNSSVWEARQLLECAEYNTRRGAWLTGFLRAGQRLFGLAIIFALLAGTFALGAGDVQTPKSQTAFQVPAGVADAPHSRFHRGHHGRRP